MKNIVFITSIFCVPEKPFTYINIRSIFSRQERMQQTIETIESARKYVPDSFIVLVECSELSNEEHELFRSRVDIFINLIGNPEVVEGTRSIFKGRGEQCMTLYGLKMIENLEYENLIKISGRYQFTDIFDTCSKDYMIFAKIHNNEDNINTCCYKLNKNQVKMLIEYFENDPDKVIYKYKGSYEEYIAEFVKTNKNNVMFVERLGIRGLVSVSGDIYFG